jgi:hypothetical protein
LVVLIQVRNTESKRNKPEKICFGLAKQTEKQPKQIEFRFVFIRTEKKKFDCFEDTLEGLSTVAVQHDTFTVGQVFT